MSRKPTQATFGNIVVLMAVLLVQGLRLQAQQATAALNGTIRDTAGSIVPDVQLTLANVATGIERKTLCNSAGNYVFLNIPPGSYVLQASKTGFSETRVPVF